MKFFKKLAVVLTLCGFSIFIHACASTQGDSQSASTGQDHVSTIPWNRPASWEGGGQIGGMMGQ